MAKARSGSGTVTKIYSLQTIGYSELSKQLDNIAAKFKTIKQAKLATEGKLISTQDIGDVRKYAEEIVGLKLEEQKLRVERQRMLNEAKAVQAAEKERRDSLRQEKEAVTAAAGSYNSLIIQYRELYKAVKSVPKGSSFAFQGQTLQYDEAIKKLKQLAAAEQDFRRQFSKDGLLVAEYASGIRQGLGGIGDIGNKVTSSLSNGFKQLKGQMAQFALTFVGVQAAMSGIQKSFSDTVAIEAMDTALKNVSRTEAEFQINTKFLQDTVNRLGLELIDTQVAFKNFYAAGTQAGLSADQTRSIFSAAAEASSTLKLTQADTNGVLLAFGQIASKGKVQAEELRGQIGERVPGAFSIAAKAIGVTQQELNGMLERGEVISTEFLPKFASELKRTFGTGTTKDVEGLQASINRLKNRFTELLQENQAGLTSFFSLLVKGAGVLIRLLPLLVASLALYTAEQIRAYVATQLTTKGTILWNAALLVQRAYTLAANIALTAYYGTIALLNGSLIRSTALTTIFGNALKAIPLGAILTLLGLVAGAVVAFAGSVSNSTKKLSELALKQLALNDINRKALEISSKQIGELNALAAVVRSTATSFDTKKKAVEDLIKKDAEFSNVIKGNVIDLVELERALGKVTLAIKAKARAEASASLTAEKQASVAEISVLRQRLESEFAIQGGKGRINVSGLSKTETSLLGGSLFSGSKYTDAATSLRVGGGGAMFLAEDYQALLGALKAEEDARIKTLESYQAFQTQAEKDLESFLATGTAGQTKFEVDIKKLKDAIDSLDKEISGFQGSQKDLTKKLAERKRLQDQLDKLLGTGTGGRTGASKLTGEQKDYIKDIEARRDELLARNEQARLNDEISEEKYLYNLYQINLNAIRKKLGLITGKNAEERKIRAQLQLDEVNNEKQTTDKLFELRSKRAQDQFEIEVERARETAQRIASDPNSSEEQKAAAQVQADQKILQLQIAFNDAMDQLEKDRTGASKKNAEARAKAIRDTEQQLKEDQVKVTQAQLADQIKAGENDIASFKDILNKKREAILESDKSGSKKAAATQALDELEKYGVLAREIASMRIQLPTYKKLLADKVITEKQYAEFYEQYVKKLGELNDLNVKKEIGSNTARGFLTNSLSKLFKFKEGSDQAKLFAETVVQSFDLAREAMNTYYQQQADRITQEKQFQLDRLAREKDQLLARANSKAEEESINKQFAAKQDKINRDAFEKNKRLQKAQARINLAIQLANLAVIAFSPNPLNIATLGAAGAIMYGVQAAIAFANYALNVSRINSAQYEFGGKPGEVPTKGGEFGGKPHSEGGTDFSFNGRNYNAEVKELAIVRTKNAPAGARYTVSGTQMEIASAINKIGGGINFQPGATLKKFESGGYLGQSLQAPVFAGSSNVMFFASNSSSDKKIEELRNDLKEIAKEQSDRIDRLKVIVVTKEVTEAQNKMVKRSSVGDI